jgi:hypothetical protein
MPLALIVVGAFKLTGGLKQSGLELHKGAVSQAWAFALVVPFLLQYAFALVWRGNNPFEVTFVCRLLVDVTGMPLSLAQFIDDLGCRTTGAVIGIFVARALIRKFVLRGADPIQSAGSAPLTELRADSDSKAPVKAVEQAGGTNPDSTQEPVATATSAEGAAIGTPTPGLAKQSWPAPRRLILFAAFGLFAVVILVAGLVWRRSSDSAELPATDQVSQPPAPPPASPPALPSAPVCDPAPKLGLDKRDIEVTTDDGVKHVVSDYVQDRDLQGSGAPWDDSVAMVREYPALKGLIAINLHPLGAQARGYREQSPPLKSAVLLITISSIVDVAFQRTENQATVSSVCLAGGERLTAGEGFGHLAGKENLGSIRSADFDSWVGDIADLKAASPTPFRAGLDSFGVHETPFRADIVDTAGTHIALTKALFLDRERVSIGNTGYDSLVFSPNLTAKRGQATNLKVPFSKISKIKLGKPSDDGYGAQLTLRTGETFDLTILSSDGMILPSSGILGASSQGWVWVPWSVVSSAEIGGSTAGGPYVQKK